MNSIQGEILTLEVWCEIKRSGDLASGNETKSDRPVERTGVSEHTGYTTYTVTGL
jgi:hypothetical protein